MERVSSRGLTTGPVQSSAVIGTRPTMRKTTGNAVCRCRSVATAYTPARRAGTFYARRRGGSLGALAHPLGDLRLERCERERAGRLVGVDVLALELTTADEQLAVAAERLAAAKRDGDGLRHDGAVERLRGRARHGDPFLSSVGAEKPSIRCFEKSGLSIPGSVISPRWLARPRGASRDRSPRACPSPADPSRAPAPPPRTRRVDRRRCAATPRRPPGAGCWGRPRCGSRGRPGPPASCRGRRARPGPGGTCAGGRAAHR